MDKQRRRIRGYEKNKMNANKAAEEIMNSHFDSWNYGPTSDFNVLKKWLDRIIRKLLK